MSEQGQSIQPGGGFSGRHWRQIYQPEENDSPSRGPAVERNLRVDEDNPELGIDTGPR